MRAWLAIAQTVRQEVLVHPMGVAAEMHPGVTDPRDFESHAWGNRLETDTAVIESSGHFSPSLQPALDPRADRIVSSRVQVFGGVVYKFSYETFFEAGFIDVLGAPFAISASSNLRPLRFRQAATALVGVGLALVGVVARGVYLAKHAWFAQYGNSGSVVSALLALAVFAAITVAGLLLPRRLWSLGRTWIPASVAGTAGILAAVAWMARGPSAEGAKVAIARNDLQRARIEGEALRDLEIDPGGADVVFDLLHLERCKAARTFNDLVKVAGEPWLVETHRRSAILILRKNGEDQRKELLAAKSVEGLDAMAASLGDLDPPLKQSLSRSALLLRAAGCIAAEDCDCVAANLTASREAGAGGDLTEHVKVKDSALGVFAPLLQRQLPGAQQAPRDRQRALRRALATAKCVERLSGNAADMTMRMVEAELAKEDAVVDAADRRTATHRRW